MDLAAVLLLLNTFIAGVSCNATFITPAPEDNGPDYYDFNYNPSYNLGQIVDIEWESNNTKFDLYIYQWRGEDKYRPWKENIIKGNLTEKSYQWTANLEELSISIDPSNHYYNVFAFVVYETEFDLSNNSIPFNITVPEDDGLSTGQIAGITAGSTVGGLLVIAALGYLAWRCFRVSKNVIAWYGSRKTQLSEENGENQQGLQTGYTGQQQPQTPFVPPEAPKYEMPIEQSTTSPQSQYTTRSPDLTYEAP